MTAVESGTSLRQARLAVTTTFRRDGTPVPTPLEPLVEGGRVYFVTDADTGKVRRLRRDARVTVAPAALRGKALGPARAGRARILEGAEAARVDAAFRISVAGRGVGGACAAESPPRRQLWDFRVIAGGPAPAYSVQDNRLARRGQRHTHREVGTHSQGSQPPLRPPGCQDVPWPRQGWLAGFARSPALVRAERRPWSGGQAAAEGARRPRPPWAMRVPARSVAWGSYSVMERSNRCDDACERCC